MKKTPKAKLKAAAMEPVFPKMMHHVRTRGEAAPLAAKAPKRENTFSKSRDTREDRGERQAKTSRNPQTLSRGK